MPAGWRIVDDQASKSFQGPVASQSSHCFMIGDNGVVRHAERLGLHPASCYHSMCEPELVGTESIDRD